MDSIKEKLKSDFSLPSEESSSEEEATKTGSERKESDKCDEQLDTKEEKSSGPVGNEVEKCNDPIETGDENKKKCSTPPASSFQSPLRLKIKLGPEKTSEMVTETDKSPDNSKYDQKSQVSADDHSPEKLQEDEEDTQEFHGFTEEEIPDFVFNSFEDIDLSSAFHIKPTMFVSISSKKSESAKKEIKPIPALKKVGILSPRSQDSPRKPTVRFADEQDSSISRDSNLQTPTLTPDVGGAAVTTPSTPLTATPLSTAPKKHRVKFWEPLYDGWTRELVMREDKKDPEKIRKEVFYHSPIVEGKPRLKFNNTNELEGHLITSGSMYPLTFFTFKKEPLGAPEPLEIIRDSNSQSPLKHVSVPENTVHKLEKRVSKNPDRLITEKSKEQKDRNKKVVKSSPEPATEKVVIVKKPLMKQQVPEQQTTPEIRTSKRTIKPPEIFDPDDDVHQRKKSESTKPAKTDSSGLWKDADNIMSPKKSFTIGPLKSGGGLLKVKMFSKLNARNVSDSEKPSKPKKSDDEMDVSFDDDLPIDPLKTDSLSCGENIAASSDDDEVKIENVKLNENSIQPINIVSDPPFPTVVSVSSLHPSLTVQRSSHLPIPSIGITPITDPLNPYPNLMAADLNKTNEVVTSQVPKSVAPNIQVGFNGGKRTFNRPTKIVYPTRKTLLPCSIHCPGTTGFPSLSCKSCHCLFHPKCVGISAYVGNMSSTIFYCNDCKDSPTSQPEVVTSVMSQPSQPGLAQPGPVQHPVQHHQPVPPLPLAARFPLTDNRLGPRIPMKPQRNSKIKQIPSNLSPGNVKRPVVPKPLPKQPNQNSPAQTMTPPATKKTPAAVPAQKQTPRGPQPPQPIGHQTMVNIGGKKFLVIPRSDLTLDSPPPSPEPRQSDDASATTGEKKLPVFLQSVDGPESGAEFEVEQSSDGNIIIKPIGSTDPVKIFGANKLKRPSSSVSDESVASKKLKPSYPHMHSAVSSGYFALLEVFKYLTVNELMKASHVCKLWKEVSRHHKFWESISLKNLKVTNWECFSEFTSRVACQSIDMRKMVFVKDRDATWSEILSCVSKFPPLKRLQLPRISGKVLVSLMEELRNLEVLNSPLTVSPLDTTVLKNFTNLKELRIKTGSGLLTLENGLKSLESLSGSLTSLSLLTVTGLTELDYDSIGTLINLEQVELGDCTEAPVTLFKTLSDLTKLTRIRLEKGCVGDNIAKLQRGDNLRQLELIDFHVQHGFKTGLKGLDNVRKLLIIPTYKDEVASSNTEILEGVTSHLKHLKSFYLGVTNEWLQAMSLVIGENQRLKSPGERECFPLEKEGKVEYISLPGLYRKVCRELPHTKVKVLKMSAGATCKQFIKSLDK